MFMFIIPFLALKKKHPIKPTGHDFSKKKKKKTNRSRFIHDTYITG